MGVQWRHALAVSHCRPLPAQQKEQVMVMLILTTKLHTPSLPRAMVPRMRLLACLDEGLQRKLTLVSAPAGFGKTTLLGEWLRRLEAGNAGPVRVAWISLDDGDNDPARFAAYLAAALRQGDEGTGRPQDDMPAGAFLPEDRLVGLINAVAALPQVIVLVLDDYHVITSPLIHGAVTYLIDHLPANLHLVIATRADPPLPLPRLRARGHLAELRQSDLRFTAEEAAAFLNGAMGLDLSARDVAALEARTEGWIAGLQMAALSLQGQGRRPDFRSEFVRALTGSHRYILDYLVEEVLERQPTALQAFLVETSILERLTGSLCDAVVDDAGGDAPAEPLPFADSQAILEYLEAANLFIVPLDDERRWYRYHRLFADLLRKRLGQTSPERVAELHRRASAWHERHGLMGEAIDHALAAHDIERAAALIDGNAQAALMRGEVTTLLRWVERLPDEMVRARPGLSFVHACALLMSGAALNAVEGHLRDVTHTRAGELGAVTDGRIAALRAYAMLFQADVDRAAALCEQALEKLPESEVFLRSVIGWVLAMARLPDGHPQRAERALAETIRVGLAAGNALIAVGTLCHQAKLQMRQGQLRRARATLERALELAVDPVGRRLPVASKALIGLGELAREWNNLQEAEDYLTEAIDLSEAWSELAAFDAYFPLARTKLARGDPQAAYEALEAARQIARRSEVTVADDRVAELNYAHLCLRQGDVAAAGRWAEARGLLPGADAARVPAIDDRQDYIGAHLLKYERLVLARLLVAREQPDEALRLLGALSAEVRTLGRVDLGIQVQVLAALAWQARGREAEAVDALAEALSLAQPGGHRRTFLDEGEPMARLLRRAAARGIAPDYVATLLAAFGDSTPAGKAAEPPAPAGQPLVEPLSARELDVLRLLAAGMSSPEIADELIVAVSTVRSHCKSIYGKLGVHSRWEAARRGRELELV